MFSHRGVVRGDDNINRLAQYGEILWTGDASGIPIADEEYLDMCDPDNHLARQMLCLEPLEKLGATEGAYLQSDEVAGIFRKTIFSKTTIVLTSPKNRPIHNNGP